MLLELLVAHQLFSEMCALVGDDIQASLKSRVIAQQLLIEVTGSRYSLVSGVAVQRSFSQRQLRILQRLSISLRQLLGIDYPRPDATVAIGHLFEIDRHTGVMARQFLI